MDSVFIIKIVSALLYPLGLVFVSALLSLIYRFRRRALGARVWAVIAVTILLVSSNPMVANKLVSSLERQYPQLKMESIAVHDAIIVLGGGLRIPLPPAEHVQLGRGSDRYWYAAQLFHAGKGAKLILSGGNIYSQAGLQGEAYYAAQLLQQWGVPKEVINVDSNSRTTAENQSNTLKLIESNNVQSALLVTSAIHMPRAYNIFKRLPISITPASADVLIRQQNAPVIFRYLPSASALQLTTAAMHEYYGEWYQRLKGWL